MKDEKGTIIEFPDIKGFRSFAEYARGILFQFGHYYYAKVYKIVNVSSGLTKLISYAQYYHVYSNSIHFFDVSKTHYGFVLEPDTVDAPYKVIFDDQEYELSFKKNEAEVVSFVVHSNDYNVTLKTKDNRIVHVGKSSLIPTSDKDLRPEQLDDFAVVKNPDNRFSYFISGRELTLMDGTRFYSDKKLDHHGGYTFTKDERFIPFLEVSHSTIRNTLLGRRILDRKTGIVFSENDYGTPTVRISELQNTFLYTTQDDAFVTVHVLGDATNGEITIQIPRFPKKIKLCKGQVREMFLSYDGKHYMFLGIFPSKNPQKEFIYKVFKDGVEIKEWTYPAEDYRDDCQWNKTFTISSDGCVEDNFIQNNNSFECFQIKHFDEVIFDSTLEKVDKFIVTENQDEKIGMLKFPIQITRKTAKHELIELLKNPNLYKDTRVGLLWKYLIFSRESLDLELQTQAINEIMDNRFKILETSLEARDKASLLLFVVEELIKKHGDTKEKQHTDDIEQFIQYLTNAHELVKEHVSLKLYADLESYSHYPDSAIRSSRVIKEEVIEALDKDKKYHDQYLQRRD